MTSASSILVAARFRPLMGRELKLGTGKVSDELVLEKQQGQEVVFRETKFTYDYIFGMESQQELVFAPARGMVASFCKGFNSTIFAYGQTGSGKVSLRFAYIQYSSPACAMCSTCMHAFGAYPHPHLFPLLRRGPCLEM